MPLKSVRTVEFRCPVTDTDVTASIGTYAVPETNSGHHATGYSWDAPRDEPPRRDAAGVVKRARALARLGVGVGG